MWKYVGQNTEGIIGVPQTDLTDEEFAEYEGKQFSRFSDQPGSLAASGLWEHEPDEPVAEEAPRSGRRGSPAPMPNDTLTEAPAEGTEAAAESKEE